MPVYPYLWTYIMVSSTSLQHQARHYDFISVAGVEAARLAGHVALQLTADCLGLASALHSFTFSYARTDAGLWAIRRARVDSL